MFELNKQLAQDTVAVGYFELSQVLLHKDSQFPWCILVPQRENIQEIHHLSDVDAQQLMRESCRLSEVMTDLFAPKKMNVAAIGNIVSQLHLHHVARYSDDPVWPQPVWGKLPPVEYTKAGLHERLQSLRYALEGAAIHFEVS